MACRCVYVPTPHRSPVLGRLTRGINIYVLQGPESGKFVLPRITILSLINHYATGISDRFTPNRFPEMHPGYAALRQMHGNGHRRL